MDYELCGLNFLLKIPKNHQPSTINHQPLYIFAPQILKLCL